MDTRWIRKWKLSWIRLIKMQPLMILVKLFLPLVIYVTITGRLIEFSRGTRFFPGIFIRGWGINSKTYWPRCREWKVGRNESRVPRLELISKIPEGEVCNYLGIMDTLGGPANFRPNYRIRSRCGRRFIGHVDGQATYKLRFLFYPCGQPDLSLFLIRIPRFFSFFFFFLLPYNQFISPIFEKATIR